MSEQIAETDDSTEQFNWVSNIEDAHKYLDKVDLTAVGRSYGLANDRRAEIIAVARPDGGPEHVIRERFGSPEGHDRRRDIYYYLATQATSKEQFLVMQDHSLEHEIDLADRGEAGRIVENHYRLAARVTEGISPELIYPEVSEGDESEMHRFLQTLSGIVSAQRAALKAA